MAAARLAALTKDLPLEVRHSEECQSDGVFTTAACAADHVLFTDVPLCWLPATAETRPHTCRSCGAFMSTVGGILSSLAEGDATGDAPGDPEPLLLPDLDVPPPRKARQSTQCAGCPRGEQWACTDRLGVDSSGADPYLGVKRKLEIRTRHIDLSLIHI